MTAHIVLLPGLLCDDAVWADQRSALRGTASVSIPDYGMRGSIPSMAEHVLTSTHQDVFFLAGHSMGGRVALEVVRRAPERVAGLALLDTGYQAREAGEAGLKEQLNRMQLLELARAEGMRTMGERWAPGMVHPERLGSDVYESILDMISRSTPERFEAQITALLSRPDAAPLLAQITCPTMLICGRQDQWSPLLRHEEMNRKIKGSRLRIIEHSGHMSTMECPNAVNAALVEWFEWSSGRGNLETRHHG